MKRAIVFIAVLICAIIAWRILAPAPGLRDGDLIFQTSKSRQSAAIGVATASAFTHMGIVVRRADGIKVIEAAGPVRETALRTWTGRGRFGRYAVYRRRDLTAAQATAIVRSAAALEGRPYDLFFAFDNRAIYCSELAWLAYRAAGLPLGKVQTVGSLNVSGPFAKALMAERGRQDGACRGLGASRCQDKLLRQTLITPVAIAHDPAVRRVYSNYPL